jgi:acid stress-induced BolA-like protein IbaG/YrbA
MEELIAKITGVLKAHLSEPGTRVELEETVPNEKVGGLIVWTGFNAMDQIDRQRMVRQVLREQLPPDDVLDVGLIVTLTPLEDAAMQQAIAA